MKKNIILVVVVFLLGIFAYLQQEKKFFSATDKLNLNSNVQTVSYRYGDLILGRSGFQFKDFPYPLQNEKIEALIMDLNQIRLIKKINVSAQDLKNFFPDENNFFKLDTVEIKLGDKVPGSAQFYLSVNRGKGIEYYIAAYELPKSDQTYVLSEEDKFTYIWGIFNYPRLEWYDKNFIKNVVGNILRIDFNHYSKKPFSLSFRDYKTIPATYNGIDLNLEKVKEFQNQLLNTTFNDVGTKDPTLKNAIAELTFEANGMEKKLQLFTEFKGQKGSFVNFTNDQYVYTLDEKNAKIFYFNLSDFWLKMPLSAELKKSSRFSLELSEDDKNYKFFKIDEQVSPSENLSEVVRLFLAIAPYEEADRISDLSKDDLIFKRDKGLFCKIFDKKYFLVVHKDEILLASLQDRYVLHYYIRGERRPIRTKLIEY